MAVPSTGAVRGRTWREWGRDLLRLRPVGVDWVGATRAGGCVGALISIGWLAGNLPAGLTASIGGFTALYGGGRPYRSRAAQLAVVAIAFTAAVCAGAWAESSLWLTVVVVAVIAVVATWLCQAFETGPPGANMFVLACATASNIPGADAQPWRLGLLVLGGGALSWFVHMAGVVAGVRRPEKAAVAAGGAAVRRLVDAVGSDRFPPARDHAARSMRQCWVVLVNQQPATVADDGTRERLRAIGLELHGLMAAAVRAHDEGRRVEPGAEARVRILTASVSRPPPTPRPLGADDVPWGGPAAATRARGILSEGSPWRLVLLRVGVAAVLAGTVGTLLGLDHAYWAVAAAALVLYQGLGWAGTLERAVLRLLGTWVGLLLTAAVLTARPGGLWLALTVALLQLIVQLLVPRNYGLGVVFITALALTIGSAGNPADLGDLLLARGVDTAIGCAIGVVVFMLIRPGAALPDPAALVARTVGDVGRVVPHLVEGSTATAAAREVRRDLNEKLLLLADAHDTTDVSAPWGRNEDRTRWWPALDATQRLAHRTLALCWALDAPQARNDRPPTLTAPHGEALRAELEELARRAADRETRSDGPGDDVPARDRGDVLAPEVRALRQTLPSAHSFPSRRRPWARRFWSTRR